MDAERWQRVRELFERAVDEPKETRLEFAERQCRALDFDLAMHDELMALLAADQTLPNAAGGLFDAAPDLIAKLDADARIRAIKELIGARLGPWKLLRELGQGGMGAVYLAERTEGDFQQQGAVKLIRPGWDVGVLQQRFRDERRILAALNHPAIARLLDGGETVDGKPYLVMEYVDGVAIDDYCDQHRLGIPERLRLYVDACAAVAYAHRALVVHRDLKPSNILVDGSGRVKLLDFGIAKLLEPSARQTGTGLRMFTPEYAAPEQVRGEPATTGVDVYALGLLLYELLTGRRAYGNTASTPAAYEHAILTLQPARPSLAVSAADAQSVELAGLRNLNPTRLRAQLRGDLDAIVMQALRKEPEQRYASVEAMMADVERYLRHEPVHARRGNLRYRARRFIERHALAVTLAGMALVSLAGGLAAALWQADVARQERDIARREALTSTRAVEFLKGLFQLADPTESLGRSITAVEILDKGAAAIASELKDEPEVRTTLLIALGDAHLGLGVTPRARELLDAALADARKVGDPVLIGSAMASLGAALTRLGDETADRDLMREALALALPPDARGEALRARLEIRLANRLNDRSEYPEAERYYRSGMARLQRATGHIDPEVAIPFSALLHATGRVKEAEVLLRDALAEVERSTPPTHPARAGIAAQLATNLVRQGRAEESLPLQERALAAKVAVYGPDHPSVDITRQNLAHTLSGLGRWAESEKLNREVLQSMLKRFGPDHASVAASQASLARTLLDSGRAAESEAYWRAALATVLGRFGPGDAATGISALGLGRTLLALGRLDEAQAALTTAATAYAALGVNGKGGATRVRLEQMRVALARGGSIDCAPLADAPGAWPDGSTEQGYAQAVLGACLRASGQGERADAMIAASLQTLRKTRDVIWPERIYAEALQQ